MELERLINLDICFKCQSEYNGEDVRKSLNNPDWFLRYSLAQPMRYLDGDTVWWFCKGKRCGSINCLNPLDKMKFNQLIDDQIYRKPIFHSKPEVRWLEALRRSVKVLKRIERKFPCKCEICGENCPYLLEHAIYDCEATLDFSANEIKSKGSGQDDAIEQM